MISKEIIARLKDKGIRYYAADNISEVLEPGDKEKLIDELSGKFHEVLKSLVIDTENDPNSIDTGRRMAKMYVNEIMGGRYKTMPDPNSFPNYIENGYEGMLVV